MRFLRNVLATIVGIFLSFFLLFIFFVFLGAIAAGGGEQSVQVSNQSILKISLNEPVEEWVEEPSPLEDLNLPGLNAATPISLVDIKKAIRQAADDARIEGIFLDLSFVSAGGAQRKEIRDELLRFKESGKFIIGYSEILTEGAYYLSSTADELYLMPEGLMEFNGLSSEIVFIKGMLDKIGVKAEVFRVGDFKSAVEPLIQEEMSEANRLQTKVYLDSLQAFFLREVAASRGISADSLAALSNRSALLTPQEAADGKLITAPAYRDEVEAKIREKLGLEASDKINYIGLKKYAKAVANQDVSFSGNKIAVIMAEGDIISGEGGDGFVGSDGFVKELKKAREDEEVKAVVIRINSPGGSALASDVMWREIQLTKDQKPVIASMSDVCASGGYYMAMACDTIVAQPNTITGSIGIFAILFDARELLTDKLGLKFEWVNTGEFSDFANPANDFTAGERAKLQNNVNRGYETFTSKAAQGRDMSVEDLKKVASGRVWVGSQAKEIGLVDVLGGLEDAVELAANAAGVADDYAVRYFPSKKDFFTTLFEQGETSIKAYYLRQELGPQYGTYQQIKRLSDWQGQTMARLPFDVKLY